MCVGKTIGSICCSDSRRGWEDGLPKFPGSQRFPALRGAGGSSSNLVMAEEVEEGLILRYFSSPNVSTPTVLSSHAMPSLRDPSLSYMRQETAGCHGGKSI